MRTTSHDLLVLGATTLAFVTPSAAQVEIIPMAGLYDPTTPIYTRQCYSTILCDLAVIHETGTQHPSSVFGLRVTDWTTRQFGFAFSVRQSESYVTDNIVNGPLGGSATMGSAFSVTMGSIGVAVRFPAAAKPSSPTFGLEGGVAAVVRGGTVFQSAYVGPEQTDWGPVVGAFIRLPLAQGLSLRFDLEDFVYWFDAYVNVAGGGQVTEWVQHDLVMSAGLAIQVGGSDRRSQP
jgi:hypothetical protein